jgi:HD superfamily phosphodiesterase
MKSEFETIRQLAKPFLDTRHNEVHSQISTQLAWGLLKREGGDAAIVIPAIMLHDVGWKAVPPELHLKAFGPGATRPELNRAHEVAGVKIARSILETVSYPPAQTKLILKIIDGHDSRQAAISINDMIVKDADKLWRYTRSGFNIDVNRFGETFQEALARLRNNLDAWFFTKTAIEMAQEKLKRRKVEIGTNCPINTFKKSNNIPEI